MKDDQTDAPLPGLPRNRDLELDVGFQPLKTAHCVIRRAKLWYRRVLPQPYAYCEVIAYKQLKDAGDERGARLLRQEARTLERLSKLNPPIAPRLVGFGEVDKQGPALVMEWIDGISLENYSTRGSRSGTDSGLVIRSTANLVGLLRFVHSVDGLNASLPDLKPDALIVTNDGIRVLDWNVLGGPGLAGWGRDFKRVAEFLVAFATATRQGSFERARDTLAGTSPTSLGDRLAVLLLQYVIDRAGGTGSADGFDNSYEAVGTLCGDYEQAHDLLLQIELGQLGAEYLRNLESALASAEAKRGRRELPRLDLADLRSSRPSYRKREVPARTVRRDQIDELMRAALTAGWIQEHADPVGRR